MKYFKFYCSNGFCGCDEEFYKEIEDDCDIDEYAQEILYNEYSFAEPDGRFISDKSWNDEITDEEYEEYEQNLDIYYEELTKEEYEENC